MSEKPKRLKKNISFSEHERDIYEYLEKQKNASAFIKRLVLNQMMIDKGMIAPVVAKSSIEDNNQNVPQETYNLKETNKNTEQPQELLKELTQEEKENQELAQNLPF